MQSAQRDTRLPVVTRDSFENIGGEGIGPWQADVHDIVGITLGRAVYRFILRVQHLVAAGSRHGPDHGIRMPRQVELQNNVDVMLSRKPEELHEFLARQKALGFFWSVTPGRVERAGPAILAVRVK